jgi:rubrerythrin
MGQEPFPLERYLNASRTLSVDDFPWDEARRYPLSREIERVMVYMLRIEAQTLFYVRDLLNTRTAYLPEVSSFLTVWLYEEERHSRLFRRFLRERGIELPADDHAQVRAASQGGIRERFEALGAKWMARATRHFVAVHMIWGATQELSTLHAYRRLGARCGHPFLRELCASIVKDERRHYAFYANMAERWLGEPAAQRLTRFLLKTWWQPVGMGVHAPEHVSYMVDWFYGDADGMEVARQMDAEVDKLPGLGGLHLYTRAVAKAKAFVADGKRRGERFEDWVPIPVPDGEPVTP